MFDLLKTTNEANAQTKKTSLAKEENAPSEEPSDEESPGIAKLAPHHDSTVQLSLNENADQNSELLSPRLEDHAIQTWPSCSSDTPPPDQPTQTHPGPQTTTTTTVTTVAATPATAPAPTSQASTPKFPDHIIFLSLDPYLQSRTSFLTRLIFDILIYSYTVPGARLLQLAHPPAYKTQYGALCLLNDAEQEFAGYLACVVVLGMGLADAANAEVLAMASHHVDTVETYISKPCGELGVPADYVFELLENMLAHGLEPVKRYKALPEALLDGILHGRDGAVQKGALAERIVADLLVLQRVTSSRERELRDLIAGRISQFGRRELGDGWREKEGKERRMWFGDRAVRLGVVLARGSDNAVEAEVEEKENVLGEWIRVEWSAVPAPACGGLRRRRDSGFGRKPLRDVKEQSRNEAKKQSSIQVPGRQIDDMTEGPPEERANKVERVAMVDIGSVEIADQEMLAEGILRLLEDPTR